VGYVRRLAVLGVVLCGLLIMGAVRLHEFINIRELMEYAQTTEDRLIDMKEDGEVHVTESLEETSQSVENIAGLVTMVKNTDMIMKRILHLEEDIRNQGNATYYSNDSIHLKEEKVQDNLELDTSELLDPFLMVDIAEFDLGHHKDFLSFVSQVYALEYAEDTLARNKEEIISKLKVMSPEEYRDYMQNVHYLINGKRIFEDMNVLKKVF
jgi:hypothetical protein